MAMQDWTQIHDVGPLREVFWNERSKVSMHVFGDKAYVLDRLLEIPGKGALQRRMAKSWYETLEEWVVTSDLDYPEYAELHSDFSSAITSDNAELYPEYAEFYADFSHPTFQGRKLLQQGRLDVVPADCLVQGYLTGDVLEEYRVSGTVFGVPAPEGLELGSKLPEPVVAFVSRGTRRGKRMAEAEVAGLLDEALPQFADDWPSVHELITTALGAYVRGAEWAEARGVIIAQARFEFAADWEGDEYLDLMLAGAPLTPDYATYWLKEDYLVRRHLRDYVREPMEDFLMAHPEYVRFGRPIPRVVIDRMILRYRRLYGWLFE